MNLKINFRKPLAFLKRDFLINSSYMLLFLFQFGSIFFYVITFFFISKIFGANVSQYLVDYGGSYFSFVLIGIALYEYLSMAMTTFTQAIGQEQETGTLEAILLSPTKISTVLISGSLWNFLVTSFNIFLYLLLGVLFFNFPIEKINIPAVIIILLLTIISFSTFGIISASFILVLKRGDPVNWLFSGISRFLGGVYFPVTILPLWLQKISYLLPITYSLHGMRMAILKGESTRDIWQDILALFLFCILLLPLSIACFKFAVRKAKKQGSLTYY
ncbi:MAG: ABC transporter permease [Candidatus Omnitrophota bacterium]